MGRTTFSYTLLGLLPQAVGDESSYEDPIDIEDYSLVTTFNPFSNGGDGDIYQLTGELVT